MAELIALPMAAFLAVGAVFHFYWGLGGRYGLNVAIPQRVDGTPLFVPGNAATLAVGLLLTLIVVFLAAYVMRLDLPLPRVWQRLAMAALASIFLARGLSWHRYFGLFKSVRSTAFARNDAVFYSPGCVAVGFGFLLLAWNG